MIGCVYERQRMRAYVLAIWADIDTGRLVDRQTHTDTHSYTHGRTQRAHIHITPDGQRDRQIHDDRQTERSQSESELYK